MTMKPFLILGCLLLCLCFNSCQCSEKPEVGPVEGATAQSETPPAPTRVG